MKVLFVTPYLYSETIPGFQRNRTGFGILLEQMADYIGDRCELSVFTNVITPEVRCHRAQLVRHTWGDVLRAAGLRGIFQGAGEALRTNGALSVRLRAGYFRMNCAALRRVIAEVQPDIIHCHGIGPVMRRYYDVCRESGVPTVMTLHGLNAPRKELPEEIRQSEIRFLQDACREHWPVSFIASGMRKRVTEAPYGLPHTENITVIPNGVALNEPPQPYPLSLPEDSRVCLCVGSVGENKNQLQAVRAFALLPEALRERSYLLIAGTVDPNYPIQTEIDRLGLTEQVRLLGFVPHAQVLSLYQQADLTVLASRVEGFGLSLAESFAQGTPCVTFADLDAAEDLYAPCAMLLCQERSDEALAAALTRALEARWEREAIRRHARKFSLDTMADRYIAWYRSVIKD